MNIKTHEDSSTALPEESIILDGQYRLVKLLHQRPRVNLYLGRRLLQKSIAKQSHEEYEPLVAIRELVLIDLPPPLRTQIEQAAFEEFVSPVVLGSPRLPNVGDRSRIDGDRHYLVIQLESTRNEQSPIAVPLNELLLSQRQWPVWLDIETALAWGAQLCRIMARLHRLGIVLGDLDPSTILIVSEGAGTMSPVLLTSWPPLPKFWPVSASNLILNEQYNQTFPLAEIARDNAFAAPELLRGVYDELSDVYSLSAILYLLITQYAPVAASLRLYPTYEEIANEQRQGTELASTQDSAESLDLIPPHLLNSRIHIELEEVVLRALALNSVERYPSVFAFAEALEAVELRIIQRYK